MLNASHSQMKRAALSAESTKSTPPLYFGWLATMPTGAPVDAREAGDELLREELLDLEPAALVDDLVDDARCMSKGLFSSAGMISSSGLPLGFGGVGLDARRQLRRSSRAGSAR